MEIMVKVHTGLSVTKSRVREQLAQELCDPKSCLSQNIIIKEMILSQKEQM